MASPSGADESQKELQNLFKFLQINFPLLRTGMNSSAEKRVITGSQGWGVDLLQFVPLTDVGSPSMFWWLWGLGLACRIVSVSQRVYPLIWHLCCSFKNVILEVEWVCLYIGLVFREETENAAATTLTVSKHSNNFDLFELFSISSRKWGQASQSRFICSRALLELLPSWLTRRMVCHFICKAQPN